MTRQGLEVNITLQGPHTTFRLTFPLSAPGPEAFLLTRQISEDDWKEVGSYRSINAHVILELALAWKELCLEQGNTVQMSIIVREHGLEVARYPGQYPAVLTVPGPEFEAGLWRV
jgi:hypothetical protein